MTGGCICAICYEDVDPVSELLQSLALCGHVFHELCLQQWIEFCPNGRAPTCPLCKQACGVKDVHRLYFQSDSSLAKKDPANRACQTNPSEKDEVDQVKLWRLEEKVRMLTAECNASREKILKAECDGHRQSELVKVLEAEKTIWRKDKIQLAESLARTQEELRKTVKHREELLERTAEISKEVAVYRLATDVNLSEVDISRLISPPGRFANKDEMIDTMTKALFLQNRAFKDLMHKCQELGLGESRAEQKSQKLMEQVKRMKARIQEMAKAEEEKENAKMRSLTRTRISAESTMRPDLSVHDVSSCDLANAFDSMPFAVRPHPKANNAGDSKEAASLPLAPVPSNVIYPDGDSDASEAQGTKVNTPRRVAGFSQTQPTSRSCEGKFTFNERSRKNLSQPGCGTILVSEPCSQSLGALTRENFAGRSELGRYSDEGELYQDVGFSGPKVKPKLIIGLNGDIDDVDALRRRPTLPIRQELGLGQGSTFFMRPQSATGFQIPATTDQAVTPESTFILSGADGRGGRVRVLKPPKLLPGGGSSGSALGVTRGKRFKSSSLVAGSRSPALKIEHFFGRD